MKKYRLLFAIPILIGGLVIAYHSISKPKKPQPKFVHKEAKERFTSDQAFHTMMDVLTHKRCVNCHPADKHPRQGEDSHKHLFGIQRGKNNFGVEAVNCNTCHQDSNNNYSGVPGAPEWALAPESMAWQGLSRIEIAKSMMDRSKNGNRSPEDIMHHLTEHELVLWAFEPGVNAEGIPREKPPVSKEDYIAAVKLWIEEGAIIPEE
ncbi:MAG: hypothetical protein ACPGJS_19110 [Flammeovirgaceae bacterium]